MTHVAPITFEELRERLIALEVPAGDARRLVWLVAGRLGAAVTTTGSHEIFLGGSELSAATPVVARHLQHDLWESNDGTPPFAATRILLGAAPHFASMSALIATELARFDLSDNGGLQRALGETEPLIELAISRGALSTETLFGLIAELQLLRVALLAVAPTRRQIALNGWRGWTQGRDFAFGCHAIEVKATLGPGSRHTFSGIHQVEAQPLPGGGSEVLHLMSFGLVETDSGGQTLPDLVEDLVLLLDGDDGNSGPGRASFLEMVRAYGGPGAVGYEHGSMKDWAVYQGRYAISFARLYSTDDPAMRLLSSDLVEQTFVVPNSVSFELLLPDQVSMFNPAINWQAVIASIVAAR